MGGDVKLKPCPFCGSKPKLRVDMVGGRIVECQARRCAANPAVLAFSELGAIRRWNRRTDGK